MIHWPIDSDEWVGIVDDDESIRRSLARLFRVQGIRAETFGSVADYLDQPFGRPCCLVLDVQLGASTGFDLVDRLQASGSAVPPIVFITARDDLAALQLNQPNLACGWLRKPLRADALLALVRPHLRDQYTRRQIG